MNAWTQPGIRELLVAAFTVVLYAWLHRLACYVAIQRQSAEPGRQWEVISGGRSVLVPQQTAAWPEESAPG